MTFLLLSVVVISVQAARCHFCSPALNCTGKRQTIISISTDDHVAVPKHPEATRQNRPNTVYISLIAGGKYNTHRRKR